MNEAQAIICTLPSRPAMKLAEWFDFKTGFMYGKVIAELLLLPLCLG
jgi:hypothetical protein